MAVYVWLGLRLTYVRLSTMMCCSMEWGSNNNSRFHFKWVSSSSKHLVWAAGAVCSIAAPPPAAAISRWQKSRKSGPGIFRESCFRKERHKKMSDEHITITRCLNFILVLANLIVSIKMVLKKQFSQKSRMKVFKVKIVWEGSKFWNNLLPPTLFWNYMVTAKQSGIFFRLFVTFSEYLNFIRVGRLYESLAIVHTAALCLFIIIGKSVTLLLKWLSFFLQRQ